MQLRCNVATGRIQTVCIRIPLYRDTHLEFCKRRRSSSVQISRCYAWVWGIRKAITEKGRTITTLRKQPALPLMHAHKNTHAHTHTCTQTHTNRPPQTCIHTVRERVDKRRRPHGTHHCTRPQLLPLHPDKRNTHVCTHTNHFSSQVRVVARKNSEC